MKYACLIYQDEVTLERVSKEERSKRHADYLAVTEVMKGRGQYISSSGLAPTTSATTVRVRNGKTLTTDGPFAETKEQLGGVYFIEAKDLNEAIQVAAKLPSARLGSIEVRPVWGGPIVLARGLKRHRAILHPDKKIGVKNPIQNLQNRPKTQAPTHWFKSTRRHTSDRIRRINSLQSAKPILRFAAPRELRGAGDRHFIG